MYGKLMLDGILNGAKPPLILLGSALEGSTALIFTLTPEISVSATYRKQIEDIVKIKAEALELNKKVQVKFSRTHMGAQAHGIAATSFTCGIIVNPSLSFDKELPFFMAHELSHIKHNDIFRMPVIAYLASLISRVALTLFLGKSVTTFGLFTMSLTSITIGFVAYTKFSQYCETQADKKALTVCSNEEKSSALNFFENLRKPQLKFRNAEGLTRIQQFYRKCLISETGEKRTDILHPSLSGRIEMIEKSLTL